MRDLLPVLLADRELPDEFVSGQATLTELSREMHTHPAATSRTLTQLVKSGLIERRPDQGDSRHLTVALTDHGRKAARPAMRPGPSGSACLSPTAGPLADHQNGFVAEFGAGVVVRVRLGPDQEPADHCRDNVDAGSPPVADAESVHGRFSGAAGGK